MKSRHEYVWTVEGGLIGVTGEQPSRECSGAINAREMRSEDKETLEPENV